MSRCRLTTEQQAQIADLAIAGTSPADIARQLGLRVSQITNTRRKLIATGRIATRPRQPWRPWTPKDNDQLINLIERGTPYAMIAQKLKRTETSIRLQSKRIGVRITTTKATMSARDVAAQLGVKCSKTVSRWIRLGWLKAANAGTAPRILWRITWDDLTVFLENPAYWVAWQPSRIPDLALREWAEELRANEERLLTQSEIARQFKVGRDTVKQWISKGWLPSVRYGNHVVPESALDGWIVPIDRKVPMNQDWPSSGFETVGRAPGAVFTRRAA
jgi:excisionase family DNA binding protein